MRQIPYEIDDDECFYDSADPEDQYEQYVMEKLSACKCGAYTQDSKGRLTVVADCCCGA